MDQAYICLYPRRLAQGTPATHTQRKGRHTQAEFNSEKAAALETSTEVKDWYTVSDPEASAYSSLIQFSPPLKGEHFPDL